MIMMMMPMTMRQKEVVVSLRRRAGAATSNAALVPSAWTLLDLQRLHHVQSRQISLGTEFLPLPLATVPRPVRPTLTSHLW